MASPASKARMVRLDGVRGIAVLSVLLFHAGPFLVPSLAPNLLPGGFIGVDLFFVLSGFLVSHILLDPDRSYGRFYVRRAARIFPALYVLLAAYLVYSLVVGAGGLSGYLEVYGLIALGLGNWTQPLGVVLPFGISQTWSLGVEEQFYALWPLILLLFARKSLTRLKYMCIVGIFVSFMAKLLMFSAGVPMTQLYGQTEGKLDDFLVGALVAVLWQSGFRPSRTVRVLTPVAVVFLGFCLLTAQPYASSWLYEGGFTAVGISAGILVYAGLLQTAETAVLACRPLRIAGRYSYSLYLWHPFIFLAVSRAFPDSTGIRVLCAAAALLVTSVVSTLVLEEPVRRLAANATAKASGIMEGALVLAPSG